MKQRVLAFLLVISMILPCSTAYATAMDLGHGSGCQHTHGTSCYNYHTHALGCYKQMTHSSANVTETYSLTTGYCKWCKTNDTGTNNSTTTWKCNYCGSTQVAFKHQACAGVTFSGWEWGSACSRSILNCSIPAQTLVCSKAGYADCVLPTLNYDFDPSKMNWTNGDVTITYSGSQTGKLVFTENGTKELTITSSSGHRIRDSVSIACVDKTKPELPTYRLVSIFLGRVV